MRVKYFSGIYRNVNDVMGTTCKRQIFQPFRLMCLLEMKLAHGHIYRTKELLQNRRNSRAVDLCTARGILQNVLCNFQSIFLGKLFLEKIIAHRDFKDVILVNELFADSDSFLHTHLSDLVFRRYYYLPNFYFTNSIKFIPIFS